MNSSKALKKKSVAGSASIIAGGVLPGYSADSYRRIIGANEKLRLLGYRSYEKGWEIKL